MALERRSPLPVGHYYVTLAQPLWAPFNDWLTYHKDSVSVESSQQDTDTAGNVEPSDVEHVFFVVQKPGVGWDAQQFGYPNITPKGAGSSYDVERVPAEETPLDKLTDATSGAGGFAKTEIHTVVIGALVIVGGWLLLRELMNSKRTGGARA